MKTQKQGILVEMKNFFQMWRMVVFLSKLISQPSCKDIWFSFESTNPRIDKKHFIYLYALHRNTSFFRRIFYYSKGKIRFKSVNNEPVYIANDLDTVDTAEFSLKIKEYADSTAKLLRKAELHTPKLINCENYLGLPKNKNKTPLISLTQDGEDFVSFTVMLNDFLTRFSAVNTLFFGIVSGGLFLTVGKTMWEFVSQWHWVQLLFAN